MRRVGEAIGRESRALGVACLGPGVNIKRSPLCGRNFEYLSEDPHLAGELAAAVVGRPTQGVGTSLKHFAANNQETDRMRSAPTSTNAPCARSTPGLRAGRHAPRGPWTVMCSYNRINGVYASRTRGCSPTCCAGVGVRRARSSRTGGRSTAACRGCGGARPGDALQQRWRDPDHLDAVRVGPLAEADVDLAASRVLTLADRALRGRAVPVDLVDADAHHALAKEAATASAVLLKNEGGLLPRRRRRSARSPSSGKWPGPPATRAPAPRRSTRPVSTPPWTPSRAALDGAT